MSANVRRVALLLLLLLGVQLWLVIGHGQYGTAPRLSVVATIFLICSLPPIHRRISAWLDEWRHPSPAARAIGSLVVFALATALLIWCGFYQHRDLIPKIHDEHMHLLQMQMLARGKLWLPQHPAADSFESFHIFVK